ncbi:hypothetical protein [Roseimicrobium sp. ORNL1]|uniref:hypothetical protein n=1 Tax=Roseimicrobium sp. ORNL1 TaxID=2711231 RepID=UPI0013E15E10|nr:hypothetical protein [Roseimicrobium sp. ORNL1]QIF01662.1 hypothetical protein G5S37_09050 [Roseimicrobium sp. ORNL1]
MTQEIPLAHGEVVNPMPIEIDHARLRKYLCSEALGTFAVVAGIMLGIQVMIIFFNLVAERAWGTLPLATLGAGWIFLIIAVLGYGCAIAIYFIRQRGLLLRQADCEGLSVGDSVLHIRRFTGGISDGSMNLGGDLQDTKLHFRTIASYAVFQDTAMRRHGIHALLLLTTSHGMRNRFLVRGIKDCEKVRDMLAAIGEQRVKLRPSGN